MLRNYVLVALRHLRRAPIYSAINVVGLAVGLACCAFILAYVVDELAFEDFHERADRIVRIIEHRTEGDNEDRLAVTYGPLAPALAEDFEGIEKAVRFMPYSMLVSRTENARRENSDDGSGATAADPARSAVSPPGSVSSPVRFQEDRFAFVDSTFLEVFSFGLLRGDPETALDAPFSAVLTRATAERYFGEADPIHQTLQVRADEDSTYDFTITGIAENPPHRTHLQFDILVSFSSARRTYGSWVDDPRNWEHPPLYTYALLKPGFNAEDLNARLDAFAARRMGPVRTQTRSLEAEPLPRIRLYSHAQNDVVPGGDVAYVYLFGCIALMILVVASINFVNLSTARAASRSREIGIRKAVGARRAQLTRQFLGEAGLTVGTASLLAIILVASLFPLFRSISGKDVTLDVLLSGWVVACYLLVCVVVAVGAGIYPALRLAALDASRTLKSGAALGGTPLIREGLLVVQFAVSIGLLIATAVVFRQLDYMQNDRLGFDKEHVVIVPLRDMTAQMKSDALTAEWKKVSGVQSATVSSGMPGLGSGLHDFWIHPEGNPADSVSLQVLTVDPSYSETYGLDITAGRDFSEDRPADAQDAFLINESAVDRLGWNDPIGKRLTLTYYFYGEKRKQGRVVGVVKDFQYSSLRRRVEPIVFHVLPGSYYYDYASARVDPTGVQKTLSAMEEVWKAFAPSRPFEPRFLDDQFDALYRSERRLGRLFGVFAALAIFTACLGLFGLSGELTQQRTKEIGIRKVLGASVAVIAVLVTKDFARMVLIAFAVAAPVCFVLMSRWLESFADRITIGAGIFAAALAVTMVLALLTVGYHAIRSALTDPVESLRCE